mgnify:CR=1 FL=1
MAGNASKHAGFKPRKVACKHRPSLPFIGERKYGYSPVAQNGKTLYVIIQDDLSSKRFQDDWIKYTVSKWGDYQESFRNGIFMVRVLSVPWVKAN